MCRVVRPILLEMLALRGVFALAVMALVVWLLLSGHPLGALIVVIAAISVRRAAESGRLARWVNRLAEPS
jgi:hypothetical protein